MAGTIMFRASWLSKWGFLRDLHGRPPTNQGFMLDMLVHQDRFLVTKLDDPPKRDLLLLTIGIFRSSLRSETIQDHLWSPCFFTHPSARSRATWGDRLGYRCYDYCGVQETHSESGGLQLLRESLDSGGQKLDCHRAVFEGNYVVVNGTIGTIHTCTPQNTVPDEEPLARVFASSWVHFDHWIQL